MLKRVNNDYMKTQNMIILAGGSKCGSTTLYEMLVNHSRINKSKSKETGFFGLTEAQIKKHMKWYLNNFPKNNNINIDATPNYLYNKKTPELIKKFVKNPKIIIILRDPAKRTYSEYLHRVKKVPSQEKRDFNEILQDIKGPNYEKIRISENNSLKKAIKTGKFNFDYGKIKPIDHWKTKKKTAPFCLKSRWFKQLRLFGNKYFQNSLYKNNVKRYKRIFKHVKIVFLEELINEPEKVMKNVYKFLRLKPEEKAIKLMHTHKTLIPNKIGKRLILLAKKLLPAKINYYIAKRLRVYKNTNYYKKPSILSKIIYNKKPRMTIKQYEKTRKILKKEYDFWTKKEPALAKLWRY